MPVDPRYDYKRIADPVHGTIGLSNVEIAVINTAAFQRLHDIRQLGLAYLVYPGASYSRFSHCVGVCHVVGMLMTALLSRKYKKLDDDHWHEIQRHRLAGLLHDIGHYPYSHALETAIENYYKGKYLDSSSVMDTQTKVSFAPSMAIDPPIPTPTAQENFVLDNLMQVAPSRLRRVKLQPPYNHEKVGARLLALDTELQAAITSTGEFTVDEISGIFDRKKIGPYTNVVSSDLDADRMDYLLRTAHFAGLPYGSIDLDYITDQIRLDDQNHVALSYNAVRAADQFLISRFLDYRQVAFHKTVAGMEWLLKDVFQALLALDPSLDLTQEGVDKRISNGHWKRLNDSFINESIARNLDNGKFEPDDAKKAAALLDRRGPKLVAGIERFQLRLLKGEPNLHRLTVAAIENSIGRWSEEFKIAKPFWKVWDNKIQLTKVGSRSTMAMTYEGEAKPDKYGESIRMAREAGGESRAIHDVPQSLTSLLAAYDYRMIRIFVLFDEGADTRIIRDQIFGRIKKDLQDAGWTYPDFVVGSEDSKPTDDDDGEDGAVTAGEGEGEDEPDAGAPMLGTDD